MTRTRALRRPQLGTPPPATDRCPICGSRVPLLDRLRPGRTRCASCVRATTTEPTTGRTDP